VLRDTTSRGLCVRVWPPHTSERRGVGGGCEQEGWQGDRVSLVFGGFAFLPVSLGPAGDCPCQCKD